MKEFKRVKTITGYAPHARFLAEVDEEPLGEIPKPPEIPSPYAFSRSSLVWNWQGKRVIEFETRHRRYEFYEVPLEMELLPVGTL